MPYRHVALHFSDSWLPGCDLWDSRSVTDVSPKRQTPKRLIDDTDNWTVEETGWWQEGWWAGGVRKDVGSAILSLSSQKGYSLLFVIYLRSVVSLRPSS